MRGPTIPGSGTMGLVPWLPAGTMLRKVQAKSAVLGLRELGVFVACQGPAMTTAPPHDPATFVATPPISPSRKEIEFA